MPSDATPFAVQFLRPRGLLNAAFVGQGLVEITGDSVVLTGMKRALIGFGTSATARYALAEVANVERQGRIVRFVVPLRGAARPMTETIALQAASEDAAGTLAARLPETVTIDVAQTRNEHSDFAEQLFSATPRAPVGPVLIALNIVVFALMALNGVAVLDPKTSDLLAWGANYAPLTTDGQWWRLLTAAFLHGGVLHLGLNMWALYVLAPVVERVYGNAFFLIVYLFSALAGSAASILWKQHVVSVGASGAVFGVYGALLVYLVVQKGSLPSSVLQQLYASALPFVGYNLVYGFIGTGIDNAAHVGGLLGGLLMGAVLARPLAPVARRAMRWPRLAVGIALGALALFAMLYLVPDSFTVYRQEQAFHAELARFTGEERILNEQLSRALRERQSRTIDDRQTVERLVPIVQRWAAAHARLTALPMDDKTPSKTKHRLLIQYTGLRRAEYAALVDALRANDRGKVDEFQRLRAAADDVLKELNAVSARPRPK